MANKSEKTKNLVFIALLSALSVILYFLEFPVIPGLSYLNIDLSDVPAAAAGIFLGPAAGVMVELIKNLIHMSVKGFGTTMGFGNLMNFIVGCAYVVPLSLMTRSFEKKSLNRYLGIGLSGLVGLVSSVVFGIVGNYLIAPPYFAALMNYKLTGAVLWSAIAGATALNVIKPVVVTVCLLPILKLGKRYFTSRAVGQKI